VGPETNYVKSGDIHIAYQTLGTANQDLVYLAGIFSHIELQWEHPLYERFLTRLSSFVRLIMLDMRGVGLSDRAGQLPLLEDQMDDLTAVLDRVGASKTAIFGASQAAPMAILYAASFPEKVSALVLYGAYASAQRREDYSWGRDPEWIAQFLAQLENRWGQGTFLEQVAPSQTGDAVFQEWWARFERFSSSPGNAVAYARAHINDDVRDLLGSVSVPTLVIQRAGDTYRGAGQGKYLAERIPGARFVELQGRDHLPFVGNSDEIVEEIEEFLTGARSGSELGRVLATILFTDIVDSTGKAVELGDSRWNRLLASHNQIINLQLSKHRGRLIDTAGDGVLALFDGPARAIRCALAIRDSVHDLGLRVRVGLHTGEVEVGADDISGLGVHIGARIAALAGPDEVLVSRTVKDLVAGSGIGFQERGVHELKGVPDRWELFFVSG
jgi:class 3 adenylate cyclase